MAFPKNITEEERQEAWANLQAFMAVSRKQKEQQAKGECNK